MKAVHAGFLLFLSLPNKWMRFVAVAEKIFRTLERLEPGNADLVKNSKAQRTDDEPGEFCTFYYRY